MLTVRGIALATEHNNQYVLSVICVAHFSLLRPVFSLVNEWTVHSLTITVNLNINSGLGLLAPTREVRYRVLDVFAYQTY